uniref:(northern house mosquito) hypothetical protein n=1 Tax=Culex pipiens TaxID=7175 RepID=A0A8D8D1K6_CULPI
MAREFAGEEKVGDCEELWADADVGGELGAAGGRAGVGVVDHRDTAAERAVEGQHPVHNQPREATTRNRQNAKPRSAKATPLAGLRGSFISGVTPAGRMLRRRRWRSHFHHQPAPATRSPSKPKPSSSPASSESAAS